MTCRIYKTCLLLNMGLFRFSYYRSRVEGSNISKWSAPVDTGRKLNVHKTFKRRPGRLLNVLCTFNLRPVSKGEDILFSNDIKLSHRLDRACSHIYPSIIAARKNDTVKAIFIGTVSIFHKNRKKLVECLFLRNVPFGTDAK